MILKSRYVVEYVGSISQKNSLIETQFNFFNKNVQNTENYKGNVIVYNPDKWGYSQFEFYEVKPEIEEIEDITLYEVLHISQ